MKTSKKQLALVRDWECRHPAQAQARKNAWTKSDAGIAWLKKNQKKKNAARDAWRDRKRIEAKKLSLQEKIFSILAPLSAPILVQSIAEQLNQPVEVITTTLDKMIMNGAPLRRCKLPGGDAVSY